MTIRDENGFELMEHDPVSGRSVWAYFDGEKTVYRTDYPVEDLIKQNAEQRAVAGKSFAGDWHHMGSVPLNILHDSGLAQAQTQGDDAFVRRFFNDSDNRAWRTKEGRL